MVARRRPLVKLRIGSLTPFLTRFSLHIPFGKKRGAKLVDPPQAFFNLSPQSDGVVLFVQIQKSLPLSKFEVGSGQESAARAAGSLLVVTLDLAFGLTLLAQEAALGTMEVVPQAPQGECLIERLNEIELVKPIVAQELSHVGVVFLNCGGIRHGVLFSESLRSTAFSANPPFRCPQL
jgi:hypothetical protein